MSTPPTTTSGAPAASLKDRLGQLHSELVRERRRTQRATALTLIVGLLLLAILCGYFVYGYIMISSVAKPQMILDFAEETLQRQLPEGRQMLEKEIIKSSPDWAARLSQQALDNVPTARNKLEEFAMEQYESSIKEVSGLTDEQFRKYLRSNRVMLEKRFKELEKSPELADASLQELEASLEAQLETDMKTAGRQLLDTLIAANAKLKLLKANQKLAPEEQKERRIVMLVRRLQQEYDPSEASKPIPGKEETGKARPPKPGLPADALKGKAPAPKKAAAPPPGEPTKKGSPPAAAEKDKTSNK